MPSEFDKALNDALAQRKAAEREKLAAEQTAAAQQRQVRTIAKQYLTALANDVRQKLVELRVPLFYPKLSNNRGASTKSWSGRWLESLRAEWSGVGDFGYWSVAGDFWLYLTEDGYFVKNADLSGKEGFEDLLQHHVHNYARPSVSYPARGALLVDVETRRMFVFEYVPDDGPRYHDLVPLIASSITKLSERKM
jgi:hypothetical protein